MRQSIDEVDVANFALGAPQIFQFSMLKTKLSQQNLLYVYLHSIHSNAKNRR